MILKKVCSSLVAAALLFSGTVFAGDDISVKYNNLQKCMEIEGVVGTRSDAHVLVSVYEESENIDFSAPVIFTSIYTSENGKVDFELKTTSGFKSGKYLIYLLSSDAEAEGVLNYVSEEGLEKVMNQINNAADSKKVSDIIDSSRRDLGIDTDVSDDVIDTTAEILLSIKKGSYTDTGVFYEDFTVCLASAYLNEYDNTLGILTTYEEELKIEMDKITALDMRTLDKLYVAIKNADYTKGTLAEQLPVLIFTAELLKCETWPELESVILGIDETGKIINDNFKIFNPDTSYYDKVSDESKVYKKLFASMNKVKSLEECRSLFEDISKDVYQDENEGNKGSGNSGSSSGGGKVSVTPYVPVEIITPPVSDKEGRFSDIESHWAKFEIEAMADSGVISGYPDGSFMPDKAVTRAEFVKLVTLAFAIPESSQKSEFEDVAEDAWYKEYVDKAVGAGLIKGVSELSFSPDGILSRQDAALVLYRYLSTVTTLETGNQKFGDDSLITDYAKDAVNTLSKAGIINGFENGDFAPESEITRAQVCKLLNSINAYLEALK